MNLIPAIFSTLMSIHSAIAVGDSRGKVRHPLAFHGQSATVLVFVGVDCPISNAYAPELKRICADFKANQPGSAGKQIDIDLVYADDSITAAAVVKHATDYGYECPALLDPKHVLMAVAGVTVTPEVAVFDSTGVEIYCGRIDDRYTDFGKQKFAATTHDLRTVLDDVLAGRKVSVKSNTAIGCPI